MATCSMERALAPHTSVTTEACETKFGGLTAVFMFAEVAIRAFPEWLRPVELGRDARGARFENQFQAINHRALTGHLRDAFAIVPHVSR